MRIDYDEVFNQLIVKYGIDKHHFEFRKYLNAIKVIKRLSHGEKILFVGKTTDIWILKNIIGKQVSTNCFLDCSQKDIEFPQDTLTVLFVSFTCDSDVLSRLSRAYGRDKVFLLYDLFNLEGTHCDREFYDVLNGERQLPFGRKTGDFAASNYYEAIYRDRRAYEETVDKERRQLYLERLIFEFAFIRDILSLRKFIQIYCKEKYADMIRYHDFLEAVETMLLKMKESSIDENSVFMYWIDGLGYGEESGMSYLKQQADESVYFENAYTVTSVTSYTMKALFLQETPIEGRAYQINKIYEYKSELLTTLKKEGYTFQYFGNGGMFEDKLYGEYVTFFMPSTMLYWKTLCQSCGQNNSKMFYLMHEIAETHWPFMSGLLVDSCKNVAEFTREALFDPDVLKQRELGKKYLDMQLEFYDSFFPKKSIRIFMSDHGSYPGLQIIGGNTHSIFFIKNWENEPHRIYKMFSYLRFTKLIQKVVGHDDIKWDDIVQEYALIEDLDSYAPFRVKSLLFEEKSLMLVGGVAYRGVVVGNEQYILHATGEERFYVKPSTVNRISVPECQERIALLRKITGKNFINVFEDDFFRHTRAIYQVIEAYRTRIGREEPGITLLKEAVSKIDGDKIVAIRGGGEHTIYMLGFLGEYMHRVNYIVDRDISRQNLYEGPGFHGKLITPEEMFRTKIDVVILSSLSYLDEMRKELEESKMNYQIIDVYYELKQRGLDWQCAFYENQLIREDFDDVLGYEREITNRFAI